MPLIRLRHTIDLFVDRAPRPDETGVWSAHDFVWKHRREPYDLIVYQLGNAACHDYMWAYLFHYPGLVVLHDAQLNQARALCLTKRWLPRTDDYLAEFTANHPDAPSSIGPLIAAGLGGALYPHWPHVKLVLESARLTAVHNRRLMRDLEERYPEATLDWLEMGVADPWQSADGGRQSERAEGARDVRERYGIPADAVVVTAFGGLTPEKRIPTLLAAIGALGATRPHVHLLLVGAAADHYDVDADIAAHGLAGRVCVAGFVSDADVPAHLAASDVSVCLRWPTNRETSASWLRCLAGGTATIISDLTHLGDVPTLDPRNWRVLDASPNGSPRSARSTAIDERTSGSSSLRGAPSGRERRDPIAVSIDVLDEAHSLALALDRVTSDAPLRARLGRAARQWWEAHHRLEPMADAYERLFARAVAIAPPVSTLPAHLRDDGTSKARALLAPFGLEDGL